jgi:pantothenate kinase type III
LGGAEGSAVFCVTFVLLAIGGADTIFVVDEDALFVGVAVASGTLV